MSVVPDADESASADVYVRLAKDGVYVNGRRLTDAELAAHFDGENPRIVVHPGCVVLNGRELDEPYVQEDPDSAYPDPNDIRTWPMVMKAVSQGKLKLLENGGILSVKLAEGEYIMIGDNRNRSSDSRFWGPLDRSRVLGRAMFVWWPFARLHWAG